MARLLLLVFISITVAVCNGTSTTDIENAKQIINDIIEANKVGIRNPEYPFIAGFVRLAFHDCVGDGHCDGCVNHTLPDNAGLKKYTDVLDIGFSAISGTISRADFYALAALTALEKATATDHTPVKFTALQDGLFKVGRIDCPTSPNEDKAPINPLPEGHFDTNETLDFFTKEFGFTAAEVVALLGAHTLGRCSAENSGYEGKWVTGNVDGVANSDLLNNLWYSRLLGNWTQVPITFNGQTKLQWQRFDVPINIPGDDSRQAAMFLNSDMSLVWDISPVAADGTAACEIACTRVDQSTTTINCCEREPQTDPTFRTYVDDNVLWMQDFTNIFIKMIDFGATGLTTPTASVSDVNKALDDDVEEIVRMLEDVKEDLNAIKADMN